MSKQKLITPSINKCWCGEEADCIDWDDKFMYRVICKKNHSLTKECGTRHRAIVLWNNRVKDKIEHLKVDLTKGIC